MKKQMVKFAGQPVGIVVPENGRLKFVAVKFNVHGLDGHFYDTIDEVRIAIRAHVTSLINKKDLNCTATAG